MGLKATVRGIARLLGISQVLQIESVRRMLARLPGARHLLNGNAQVSPWARVHPFDIGHGTDTSGFVAVTDLDQLEHEAARAQSLPYVGSQPSIVRAVLAALPRLDSFAFVDLGCGKGRPLLVASEFSFRRIVGVELSASLAKTAQINAKLIAQRFPQRPPIEVVIGDASQFALPAGNLVLFLYNPFGDEVITKIAAAVNAALTAADRTVYVIYYNPVVGHRFDASPLLRRHFAGTLPYAAEELGYGPDTEDPIVVWQGGIPLGPVDARANARIEIIDPSNRVKLVAT
jgi:predicted RNA methylase